MKNSCIIMAFWVLISLSFTNFCMEKSLEFSPNKKYIFFKKGTSDLGEIIEIYTPAGKHVRTIKADNTISCPKFNKKNPSQCIVKLDNNTTYTTYFYDLENDIKKKLSTSSEANIDFIAQGKKILIEDKKKCALYDIEEDSTKKILFNNKIEKIEACMESRFIFFTVANEGIYRYVINEDTVRKIIDQEILFNHDLYFNDNLKNFMLINFHCKNPTLNIYASNNSKKSIITQQLNLSVGYLKFITNSIILAPNYDSWFDKSWFLLNIKKNSRTDIHENAEPGNSKKFIFFSLENGDIKIYSIKQEKLVKTITNKTGEFPLFYFNTNESYFVILIDTTAEIYETKKWEKIDSITFKPDIKFPSASVTFSPCGKTFCISSVLSDEIVVYSIPKKKLLLTSTILPTSLPQYTATGQIAFQENEKTIVLYDYNNDKKTKYDAKKQITSFTITDTSLFISTGEKTKIIPIKNI